MSGRGKSKANISKLDRSWPWFIAAMLLNASIAVKFGLTISLAMAVSFLGSAFLLTRPFAAIAALVLFLPVELNLAYGEGLGRITLIKLISFLALGSILRRVLTRRKNISWTPVNLWVLLYLFLWGLHLFNESASAETWALIKDVAWFISLFVIGLYGLENEQEARRLIFLFLAEMSLIALFGFFQLFAGTTWIKHFELSVFGTWLNGPYDETIKEMAASGKAYWEISYGGPRIIGTFFNPDYYCAFLGYPLSLASALVLKTRGKERLLGLIAWLLIFGNVLLTYSRGGWISMAVSSFTMLMATGNALKLLIVAVACIPLLILLRGAPRSIPAIGARFLSIGKSTETDPRLDIWAAMLKKIKDHPFFGHGEWGYITTKRFPHGVHGHSLYVELLYSVGIAGLLVFLILLGLALTQTFRCRNRSAFAGIYSIGFLGGLVWFICQNGVDFQFHQTKNGGAFWFFLGLLFSTTKAEKVRS